MDVDLTRRAFEKTKVANPLLVARDGEEALEWIGRWERGEERPMVVLLDLNLPKVNGLDVLKAYKGNPASRSIPVVALTTSKDDRDVQAAYSSGVNSYILKPAGFEGFQQLLERIQQYWCAVNVPDDGAPR